MFPEFDTEFLETSEGSLLKAAVPPKEYGDVEQMIRRVEELTVDYAKNIDALQGVQLPPDVSLELVRSAVRLLQRYLDSVEQAQRHSRHPPVPPGYNPDNT